MCDTCQNCLKNDGGNLGMRNALALANNAIAFCPTNCAKWDDSNDLCDTTTCNQVITKLVEWRCIGIESIKGSVQVWTYNPDVKDAVPCTGQPIPYERKECIACCAGFKLLVSENRYELTGNYHTM